MISRVYSAGVIGIDGYEITVECSSWSRVPRFDLVGLPDAAVKEAKNRVMSACENSGIKFPALEIMINLAPADLKKEGAGLDLPIALGIIKASGQLGDKELTDTVMIGELSLDGTIRAVTGVLPILISAREKGYKKAIIPCDKSV